MKWFRLTWTLAPATLPDLIPFSRTGKASIPRRRIITDPHPILFSSTLCIALRPGGPGAPLTVNWNIHDLNNDQWSINMAWSVYFFAYIKEREKLRPLNNHLSKIKVVVRLVTNENVSYQVQSPHKWYSGSTSRKPRPSSTCQSRSPSRSLDHPAEYSSDHRQREYPQVWSCRQPLQWSGDPLWKY